MSTIEGVWEWCAHCGSETLLPYIEDVDTVEVFRCSDCGRFLEPDAQKDEPYLPVAEIMGMNARGDKLEDL